MLNITTIKWEVAGLEYKILTENKSNIVTNVHWRCLGNDGTHTDQINGVQQITFNESDDFVYYENLTEQIVFSWLEKELGKSKEMIELTVKAKVDEQRQPKVGFGLPWKS